MFKLPCERSKERFWRQVKKTEYCWNWTGAKNNQGYGYFGIYYKQHSAHRISWHLTKGPIPHGLFVLHKCDNPSCVNPEHLFLGTHSDNMQDMYSKQREPFQYGEAGNGAKLTWQQVRAIRTDPRPSLQIAKDYVVGPTAINRIKRNKTWRIEKDPLRRAINEQGD